MCGLAVINPEFEPHQAYICTGGQNSQKNCRTVSWQVNGLIEKDYGQLLPWLTRPNPATLDSLVMQGHGRARAMRFALSIYLRQSQAKSGVKL